MLKSLTIPILSALVATSFVDAAPEEKKKRLPKATPNDTSRIVGGEDAEVGDYPYFVQGPGCGSFLWGTDIIIGAAHCGQLYKDKQLVVGSIRDYTTEFGAQAVFCDELILDPLFATGCDPSLGFFDKPRINWDFSLCRLDKPIIPDNPKNIRFELNFDDAVPQEDDPLLVMGFGALASGLSGGPEFLQDVTVPYVTNEVCNEPNRYDRRVTEQMLCAGFPDVGEKDACQGDSGGPIVIRNEENGETIDRHLGVVSWGFGCADPQYPGVYSRTSKRTDWLIDTACNTLKSTDSKICGNLANSPPVCNGSEFVATVRTDDFGSETSWTLANSNGDLLKFRKFEADNTEYEHGAICIPKNDCYTFTISDSFGDGLCTLGNCGFYKANVDGQEVFSVMDPEAAGFLTEDSKTFCVGSDGDVCTDAAARCGNIANLSDARKIAICNRSFVAGFGFDLCSATCGAVGVGPCANN